MTEVCVLATLKDMIMLRTILLKSVLCYHFIWCISEPVLQVVQVFAFILPTGRIFKKLITLIGRNFFKYPFWVYLWVMYHSFALGSTLFYIFSRTFHSLSSVPLTHLLKSGIKNSASSTYLWCSLEVAPGSGNPGIHNFHSCQITNSWDAPGLQESEHPFQLNYLDQL